MTFLFRYPFPLQTTQLANALHSAVLPPQTNILAVVTDSLQPGCYGAPSAVMIIVSLGPSGRLKGSFVKVSLKASFYYITIRECYKSTAWHRIYQLGEEKQFCKPSCWLIGKMETKSGIIKCFLKCGAEGLFGFSH